MQLRIIFTKMESMSFTLLTAYIKESGPRHTQQPSTGIPAYHLHGIAFYRTMIFSLQQNQPSFASAKSFKLQPGEDIRILGRWKYYKERFLDHSHVVKQLQLRRSGILCYPRLSRPIGFLLLSSALVFVNLQSVLPLHT
uniref:DUF663 domain-containing protein n=1 Tax=Heterorhabditis bacteriophora TaxID=37862 RepID=A0A1I7X5W7_HETBA